MSVTISVWIFLLYTWNKHKWRTRWHDHPHQLCPPPHLKTPHPNWKCFIKFFWVVEWDGRSWGTLLVRGGHVTVSSTCGNKHSFIVCRCSNVELYHYNFMFTTAIAINHTSASYGHSLLKCLNKCQSHKLYFNISLAIKMNILVALNLFLNMKALINTEIIYIYYLCHRGL